MAYPSPMGPYGGQGGVSLSEGLCGSEVQVVGSEGSVWWRGGLPISEGSLWPQWGPARVLGVRVSAWGACRVRGVLMTAMVHGLVREVRGHKGCGLVQGVLVASKGAWPGPRGPCGVKGALPGPRGPSAAGGRSRVQGLRLAEVGCCWVLGVRLAAGGAGRVRVFCLNAGSVAGFEGSIWPQGAWPGPRRPSSCRGRGRVRGFCLAARGA